MLLVSMFALLVLIVGLGYHLRSFMIPHESCMSVHNVCVFCRATTTARTVTAYRTVCCVPLLGHLHRMQLTMHL